MSNREVGSPHYKSSILVWEDVTVKAAVKSAIEYLQFVQNELGGELQDVRLEEVELSEDKSYWLITLGYQPGTGIVRDREYKIFKVNATDSLVMSMKIRQP